jgi:hypothetical protein
MNLVNAFSFPKFNECGMSLLDNEDECPICTYFNLLIFNYNFFISMQFQYILFILFFNFNKLGVGKEIKIALSEVDHLHNELGHYVKVIALMSFSNSFCYK